MYQIRRGTQTVNYSQTVISSCRSKQAANTGSLSRTEGLTNEWAFGLMCHKLLLLNTSTWGGGNITTGLFIRLYLRWSQKEPFFCTYLSLPFIHVLDDPSPSLFGLQEEGTLVLFSLSICSIKHHLALIALHTTIWLEFKDSETSFKDLSMP